MKRRRKMISYQRLTPELLEKFHVYRKKAVAWPSSLDSDPKKALKRKVQELGAARKSVGLIEIDREVVSVAIQLAVPDKSADNTDTNDIKRRADDQLFKPNARTFILINQSNDTLIMDGSEPTLWSEHQFSGRLVGISMIAARGIEKGNIALVIFEVRVCENDLYFSIKFPKLFHWTDTCRFPIIGPYACPKESDADFYFGSGSDSLTVIAGPYGQSIPRRSTHKLATLRKVSREHKQKTQMKYK